MGLNQQLHLKGNNYSNASTSFYVAVLIFALPNVWLLNKLPVSKYLSLCLIGWGATTACHAAIKNYSGLLTVRILSGVCESGVPPALMLLSSQYYSRKEQAPRFAYWYMGMGWGQISGGLISYGFQFVSPKAALAGWRIMFLTLGLFTAFFGVMIFLFVPDTPMKAKFLNEEEKAMLIEHIKVDQIGIENKRFKPSQVLEALLDVQTWCVFLIIALQTSGAGVVTAYSATLLKGYGYSSKASALLNMPSGVINIVATLSFAFFVRRFGNRWAVNVVGGLIAWTGACLLAFLPNTMKGGLLTGLYLINTLPGASLITFHWLTSNTAGHTKRSFATAWMNAAFAVGNIIGPQTFQAKDAPGYKPAKLTLVVFWMVAVLVSVVLVLYYRFANKRRDRVVPEATEDVDVQQAFTNKTDKQNLSFRYQY